VGPELRCDLHICSGAFVLYTACAGSVRMGSLWARSTCRRLRASALVEVQRAPPPGAVSTPMLQGARAAGGPSEGQARLEEMYRSLVEGQSHSFASGTRQISRSRSTHWAGTTSGRGSSWDAARLLTLAHHGWYGASHHVQGAQVCACVRR
jgi:hypothetical protein